MVWEGCLDSGWLYTSPWTPCPLPVRVIPQVRNEGVGILLDEHVMVAWKDVEESWEAISSQMVMARLKVV